MDDNSSTHSETKIAAVTTLDSGNIQKQHLDNEKRYKKHKFKVDAIENISFDGEYQLTDSAEQSDEDGSDEETVKKTYAQRKAQKVPKKPKIIDKPHIVMNVSEIEQDTKYDVIKFVGKKIYHWVMQTDPEATNWDLFWTDNAVQPEQLGRMQPHQKINHFPGMFSLARKNHLGRNLMKLRRVFPEDYKFFPQTWLLPAEYGDFKNQFVKGKTRTFIVKPEASCQGRGIFLTRSLDSINPQDHYVAQRYLHKPFLIEGLKFDLRIYVLLAGCDPLRVYVFEDGLVRFATEAYTPPSFNNLEDMCMHLTNYAINKDNPNFVFNTDSKKMDVGHKRGIKVVFGNLAKEGKDIQKLWHEIDSIIIKTLCSAQPILSHHYKSCQPDNFANNMCFEVLGIDIFLDWKLKPYLLEVNHTPSFTTDTPLDSMIKKNLIRDTLRLMNINTKTKYDLLNQRRELMQQRVLTGKKLKLTIEEKKDLIQKAQAERDAYEDQYLGGYRKIYPLEDAGDYDKYLQVALKQYEDWTGANIRRNTKKPVEEKKLPKAPPYKSKAQQPLVPYRLPQIKKENIDSFQNLRQERVYGEDDNCFEDIDYQQQQQQQAQAAQSPFIYQQNKQVIIKPRIPPQHSRQVRSRERITIEEKLIQNEIRGNGIIQNDEIQPIDKPRFTKNKTPIRSINAQVLNTGNFVMPRLFEMGINSNDSQSSKKDIKEQTKIINKPTHHIYNTNLIQELRFGSNNVLIKK